MNNKKTWYEKASIWVTLISGICAILGVSIFGGRSLINSEDTAAENVSQSHLDESRENNNSSQQNMDSINESKDTFISKETENESEDHVPESSTASEKIKVTEIHTPTDSIISVSYPNWNVDNDYGIDGKRYGGGLKVTISHMLSALGDNSNRKITSRIMIPISNDINSFSGVFVLHQSMYGSKSSAQISILVNNESLFTTDEINGDTLDSIPFSIDFENADSIIIETKATLRGSDFTFGIVSPKE